MHQHLQSTYYLKQSFLKKHEGWQTLVANQSYGTFYTLCGRFHFEENTFKPQKCDLYLQNYQGNVTIGIASVNKEIRVLNDTLLNRPTLVLIVHLKALHNKICSFDNEIEIENNNYNINEFNDEYSLKVEFIFDEITAFNYQQSRFEVNNNGEEPVNFVDEARALREGDDLVLPNYNKRLNVDIIEHYRNFYQEKLGISINEFDLINKRVNKVNYFKETVGSGGYLTEREIYDEVTIVNSNDGSVIISENVLKPYPCANNYVRLVKG